MMEIELKFRIPNAATLAQLKRVVRLGPFTPGPTSLRQTRDQYLDTISLGFYERGYALRRREVEGTVVLTLKGLGSAEAAVHERIEHSLEIPGDATIPVEKWPQEPPWDEARAIAGDSTLDTLFSIEQTRWVRELYRDDRLVIELSVDEVKIAVQEKRQSLWVLEAELCADGTREDLQELAQHLVATWKLTSDPLSKFHHGLVLLNDPAADEPVDQDLLTMTEKRELERIANEAEQALERERAQLILAWAEGEPIPQTAERLGRSRSWGYHWVSKFREERMEALDEIETWTDQEPEAGAPAVAPDILTLGPLVAEYGETLRSLTVKEMGDRYRVDWAHAQRVAEHAVVLFDATESEHSLSLEQRQLLETMSLLHNVGLDADPGQHHISGRDIILEHPLVGLSDVEQRMIAAAVYLHRKRIKKKKLRASVVTSLPNLQQRHTLELAALLRIADGLDYSQEQSSRIDAVETTPSAVRVIVSGPLASVDVARARKKSDLWARLHSKPMVIVTQAEAALSTELAALSEIEAATEHQPLLLLDDLVVLESPGLLPEDLMSEAGRKIMHYYLMRLLSHEAGTRAGEDPEELHDMRVATRRLRAALRVFAPYYKKRTVQRLAKRLKRAARLLGAVRDLDVALLKAEAYLASLPAEKKHDLDPLFEMWKARREQARQQMLDYMESTKYQDLQRSFALFVQKEGRGIKRLQEVPPEPVVVRHVLPSLIYVQWARVRAFEPILDDPPIETLHALRIACKYLRYTLEFFRELLGPQAKNVIAEVVRLQDHLGDLNDADVAISSISEFLFPTHRDNVRVIAPGVVSYLAAKQGELQEAIQAFPEIWADFCRAEVREWLASMVAAID